MKKLLLTFALFGSVARAAAPAICQSSDPRVGHEFEVGLQLRGLMPNKLPGFANSLPVYGPIVGIPLYGNTLQLQALYGTGESTIVTLVDLSYRIGIPTPFFNAFTMLGTHYLHYSRLGINYDEFGANLGLGLAFAMGKNFELSLSFKTYVQSRAILGFGGGFSFLI